MKKEKLIYLPIGILSGVSAMSGLALLAGGAGAASVSGTCTQTNGVTTCNYNDATAKVTVSEACTFSGSAARNITVSTAQNPSINTGAALQVSCNNAGGFGIYAVGYSNNTYGNNTMYNANGSIASGTATSGNTSNWAMMISTTQAASAQTTENGFGSYRVVPTAYTKVVTYKSSTGNSTVTSFTPSYQVYRASNLAAGTYVGVVKYALVPAGGTVPTS